MIQWTRNSNDRIIHGWLAAAVFAVSLPLSFIPCRGQDLTQREIATFHSSLGESWLQFEEAVAGVSAKQWLFKPSSSKWSMAEIAEHIILADQLYLEIVESCLKTQANKRKGEELQGKEQEMIARLKDPTVKAVAPEPLIPKGAYPTKREALTALEQQLVLSTDFFNAHAGSYSDHITPHPQHGELTAYQWMLMIPAHSNHHVAQIRALKNLPGYPAD